MRADATIDLSVAEIMSGWPSTARIFIDHRMHCVGCPIAPFHTLVDAAGEHGLGLDELVAAVEAEMARSGLRAGPAVRRRR